MPSHVKQSSPFHWFAATQAVWAFHIQNGNNINKGKNSVRDGGKDPGHNYHEQHSEFNSLSKTGYFPMTVWTV